MCILYVLWCNVHAHVILHCDYHCALKLNSYNNRYVGLMLRCLLLLFRWWYSFSYSIYSQSVRESACQAGSWTTAPDSTVLV